MYTITHISPKQLESTFYISFKIDNKIGQVDSTCSKKGNLIIRLEQILFLQSLFSLFKIPGLSSTFNKIPGLSRPGFLFFKFKDFPGFPGPVRTLVSHTVLYSINSIWSRKIKSNERSD